MALDTWVSTLTMVGAMFALYFTLRREVRSDIDGVRADIARLESRVSTLDDRVYGLAVGLRPLIDGAADKPTS